MSFMLCGPIITGILAFNGLSKYYKVLVVRVNGRIFQPPRPIDLLIWLFSRRRQRPVPLVNIFGSKRPALNTLHVEEIDCLDPLVSFLLSTLMHLLVAFFSFFFLDMHEMARCHSKLASRYVSSSPLTLFRFVKF